MKFSFLKNKFEKLRAIPPAAGTLSPLSLLWAIILFSEKRIKSKIRSQYPDSEIYFFNSGKSALTVLFQAIQSTTGCKNVWMSAYTCPDIASSAVKAGAQIFLFDVDPTSLKPIYPDQSLLLPDDSAGKNAGALVLSNLYGLLDPFPYALMSNMFIVDDLCQAGLGERSKVNFPLIKVYSFGRGKAFPAGGGGMLVVPRLDCGENNNLPFQLLNREIRSIYQNLEGQNFFDSFFYFIKVCLIFIFERPILYWIPLLVPGLKIGETKVVQDFSVEKGGKIISAAAMSLLGRKVIDLSRKKRALESGYPISIKGVVEPFFINKNSETGSVLIRYPVVLSERLKDEICRDFGEAQKLGLSLSYPKSISEYEEFCDLFAKSVIQGAKNLAKSVVTLPVHSYSNKGDVSKIQEYLLKKLELLETKSPDF
ncbi:MAG TPA: hypothetical protein PKA63_10255 [Oligoflexia bacterium]|nr:hypothetical protein [Oligoflexia bacterium]HMP49039.1 hypothetical protein [Oligoflexia bacterium]